MAEIEPLHKVAYDHGADPIEHAVSLVKIHIDTRDEIRASRVTSPNAFPIFTLSLDSEPAARRIVAVLLDAGWTPPNRDAA